MKEVNRFGLIEFVFRFKFEVLRFVRRRVAKREVGGVKEDGVGFGCDFFRLFRYRIRVLVLIYMVVCGLIGFEDVYCFF